MKDALKLALEALECALSDDKPYIVKSKEAITAIKEGLAQLAQETKIGCVQHDCDECKARLALPAQEPTCPECKAAVLYECVACSSNNYPPAAQSEERNFCPRCGKRTADLITIHTCTPPTGV
jgi:hypothetical protein